MQPLCLRVVAGGAGGMRDAGPGAVAVADEPQGGHDQDEPEASPVTMTIMEDEDDKEEGIVTEAEEPSSRAGQEPAHDRVAMVSLRDAAAVASASPSSRRCAQGCAAALEIAT